MASVVHTSIPTAQDEAIQQLVNVLQERLAKSTAHSTTATGAEEASGRATRARTRLIVEGFANLALVVRSKILYRSRAFNGVLIGCVGNPFQRCACTTNYAD
jgi:hypothetical protein